MRKAILAGFNLSKHDAEFQQYIEECIQLAKANHIDVIDVMIQKGRSLDPKSVFRYGKLMELADRARELDVDCIIFYNELSIVQLERIQQECQYPVIDRTNLILDIFSSRAKTKIAKLQTEMARIKYSLPRILKQEYGVGNQRGGSANNKGAGESRLELVKRNIRFQLTDLKKQIQILKKHQALQDQSRKHNPLKKIALVGYTNAGKSSLMNAILKKNQRSKEKMVFQKDMLFATLDTTVRNIQLGHHQEALLFDTVGFVSNLPHLLIEAFQSTLKAACDADVLIHVMDASNSQLELQREVTMETLRQIQADHIPIIHVYNKMDLVKDASLFDGLCISAMHQQGIDALLDQVSKILYPSEFDFECLIPYKELSILQFYRKVCRIVKLAEKEEGIQYHVSGSFQAVKGLYPYRCKEENIHQEYH